jgi:hypothetical protein
MFGLLICERIDGLCNTLGPGPRLSSIRGVSGAEEPLVAGIMRRRVKSLSILSILTVHDAMRGRHKVCDVKMSCQDVCLGGCSHAATIMIKWRRAIFRRPRRTFRLQSQRTGAGRLLPIAYLLTTTASSHCSTPH